MKTESWAPEVWSNATYLLAAGPVLDKAPAVGFALMTVAVLSTVYHASRTPDARRLDRFGVLLLLLALLAHLVWPWWVSVALIPAAGLAAYTLKPLDPIIAAAFGLLIGRLWPESLLAALIFLAALAAAAYAEQYEDVPGDARYQVGHSIWHFLSALAIMTLIL